MVNVFDEVSELEFEHATVNNRLRSTQNRERFFEKKRTFLIDLLFMIFPFSTDRGLIAISQAPWSYGLRATRMQSGSPLMNSFIPFSASSRGKT